MRLLGVILGIPASLFFISLSFFRKSRPMHPRGQCFLAEVTAADESASSAGSTTGSSTDSRAGSPTALAKALSGSALVRCSGSIWKRTGRSYELLGVAIRFGWREGQELNALPEHQDLLLATVKHMWSLLFAPITTHERGYFSNDYFGALPFKESELGVVKFRMVPAVRGETDIGDRETKLLNRVALDQARFVLEYSENSLMKKWKPLVEVRLTKPLAVDQRQLRFNPFNAGKGIEPVGFLNGLRKFTYLGAQQARAEIELQKKLKLSDLRR